jgi:restriction endonuclease S subunit
MLRSNLQNNSYTPQIIKEEASLLEKKDQQIRRLQAELEQEKRRADNAIKMHENFKSIQLKYEEGGDSLRSEMTRRLKA